MTVTAAEAEAAHNSERRTGRMILEAAH